MKSNRNRQSVWRGPQTLAAAGLALAMLLATVMTLSAQPMTAELPEISKKANLTHMRIGETIRFTIAVRNLSPPDNQATWRSVRVLDEIDPAFGIDKVDVTPASADVSVTDNVVWVKFDRLEPGDSFVVTIDCTLVGPAQPGEVIDNVATLRYKDLEGKEQTPIDSGAIRIVITTWTWKPPQLVKTANNKHCLTLGDSVRFTIAMSNFTPPWNFATWYQVQVVDDIDPLLRIDDVRVTPPADDVNITSNKVVVTFNTLAPGASYVITIDATLIGPFDPNYVILNKAVAYYQDEMGNPQPPWESDLARVCTRLEIYLPIMCRKAQ